MFFTVYVAQQTTHIILFETLIGSIQLQAICFLESVVLPENSFLNVKKKINILV